MLRKSFIIGIKGYSLSKNEKIFLRKNKPWGVILFTRNIKNINQVKFLTQSIRKIMNDKKYPILIDQEGGKVSRLNKIKDFGFFSQRYFGKLYKRNKKLFYDIYKFYVNSTSSILKEIGININTSPVLDVLRKKTHAVIGNRSFSSNPKIVRFLGKLCVDFYHRNRIATVIKHLPGHGPASLDSHKHLPIVKMKKSKLISNDFKPFIKTNSFFAMTAHIIYSDYDQLKTATHSKKIIKTVIRKKFGFKGILISDDISMKALKFGLKKNTIEALNAGCNVILHCNANIKEMKLLANIVPRMDSFMTKKTSEFYKFLG